MPFHASASNASTLTSDTAGAVCAGAFSARHRRTTQRANNRLPMHSYTKLQLTHWRQNVGNQARCRVVRGSIGLRLVGPIESIKRLEPHLQSGILAGQWSLKP